MDGFKVKEQMNPLLLAKLKNNERKRARNTDSNNP